MPAVDTPSPCCSCWTLARSRRRALMRETLRPLSLEPSRAAKDERPGWFTHKKELMRKAWFEKR